MESTQEQIARLTAEHKMQTGETPSMLDLLVLLVLDDIIRKQNKGRRLPANENQKAPSAGQKRNFK